MQRTFSIFVILQMADFGTTLTALRLGGGPEPNLPLLQIVVTGSLEGLVLAKLAALGIGAVCLLASKRTLLCAANVAGSAVIAWNLSVIARLLG